jgi:SAM-dependent methyltransferase
MPRGSGERWADDYERGRPGWPDEVTGVASLEPSATVLELAAGTGKLTRLLATRFERVVAVEPADPMRRRLAALCPGAETLAGSAEEIPVANATADAVFVAEAFHHFDVEHALREISRVLRPRGALVLMWNMPAGPWKPSIAAVEEMLDERIDRLGALSYDPLDLGGTLYTSRNWSLPFATSAFGTLHEVRFPNPQTVDREGLIAFLASMGWIADLPDPERLPLLSQIKSRLGHDQYRRVWATHVHWTRLSAPSTTAS